ncbi:MAG: hypothetical protein LBF04_03570, partial [Prevotellaceae bacterium]|nr:hypothetical protein [Prevotellaceae bacterium]
MKKIIYLFALAVLITACSKDDETPKYIDENLIGEWEMLECYQTTNNTGIINIDSAKYYEIFN